MLRLFAHSVVCFYLLSGFAAAQSRPNIVVILSDDMGYSDIGCYGSEIDTPVLNGLAENGIRFTQFYNTARCCPTRASLLTGLYPHQAGVGHMMEDLGVDGYRGELNRRSMTIAEVLHKAGYGTYMAGKWHVTRHVKPDGPKDNWPVQRGFDRFYGTIHGAGSFFDPNSLTRDNTQVSPASDPEYKPDTYYYTDAISDHASRFITEHHEANADKPLFMYVAYTAAHWPMHALPEDIEKYKGRYDKGYSAFRESRLARMKELGVVPADIAMSPGAEDWSKVQNREWELRCMEVYAAMIDRMDVEIGKVLQQLRDMQQFDNTLILFLSDNGASAEIMVRDDGHDPAASPGSAESYLCLGPGWSNACNTPFRRHKTWVHEGGISTPLIAHWPNGISAKGELRRSAGHVIDVVPTILEVCGAKPFTEWQGTPLPEAPGKSLLGEFAKEGSLAHDYLWWFHDGHKAVRMGNWKLVAAKGEPWELYDVQIDRAEQNDRAREWPQIVEQLEKRWNAAADEFGKL